MVGGGAAPARARSLFARRPQTRPPARARPSATPPPHTRTPRPARSVLLDGLRARVPTPHSLALCFMFGPLGVLSHLLTRWAAAKLRGGPRAPFA